MTYILIILAGMSNRPALDHVEFTSLQACNAAAAKVEKNFNRITTDISIVCVPKSEETK